MQVLLRYTWLFIKRGNLDKSRTEGGCCEDTGRRQAPTCPGGRPKRKPTSLQDRETSFCLSHAVGGTLISAAPAQEHSTSRLLRTALQGGTHKTPGQDELLSPGKQPRFHGSRAAKAHGQDWQYVAAGPGLRAVCVLTGAGGGAALACHPLLTKGDHQRSRPQRGRLRAHTGGHVRSL